MFRYFLINAGCFATYQTRTSYPHLIRASPFTSLNALHLNIGIALTALKKQITKQQKSVQNNIIRPGRRNSQKMSFLIRTIPSVLDSHQISRFRGSWTLSFLTSPSVGTFTLPQRLMFIIIKFSSR